MIDIWWDPCSGLQKLDLLYPQVVESREQKAFSCLLGALILFIRAVLSWLHLILNLSRKLHLLIPSTEIGKGRFQHANFERAQHPVHKSSIDYLGQKYLLGETVRRMHCSGVSSIPVLYSQDGRSSPQLWQPKISPDIAKYSLGSKPSGLEKLLRWIIKKFTRRVCVYRYTYIYTNFICIQGGAKVPLQSWVHKTQSLFLYY